MYSYFVQCSLYSILYSVLFYAFNCVKALLQI